MLQRSTFRVLKIQNYEKWGGGVADLYEIYIGLCPSTDCHNMHIDCLTYDYSILFLLPIYMVNKTGYLIIGVPSV